MDNFLNRDKFANDRSPESSTLPHSVTCRSCSVSLTNDSCSNASFSICLHRCNIIRSMKLQPLRCSKPSAIIDESVASIVWILAATGNLSSSNALYSVTGLRTSTNRTVPPFFNTLSMNFHSRIII